MGTSGELQVRNLTELFEERFKRNETMKERSRRKEKELKQRESESTLI